MNHRRGQRWQTDLAIRIAVDPAAIPVAARLQDLSHHGARVHLYFGNINPGKTLAVWLPKMAEPIQALVLHRRGGTLGLLWIEHSPWVDHTLVSIVGQASLIRDNHRFGQDAPAHALNPAVGVGLPRALPYLLAQSA